MSEVPEIRIGNAEREEALQRLSEHFAAGRLSVAEFDERSAVVAAARTRGELDEVFTDLPAPVIPAPPVKKENAFLASLPERAMPVVVILAIILFFVTNQWLWFLAIPLAGAVLFGGRHNHREHQRQERIDRHQERIERHRERLERHQRKLDHRLGHNRDDA